VSALLGVALRHEQH
ncbi:hypothetical protein TNCT_642921, partial [Trichonephila clavata]